MTTPEGLLMSSVLALLVGGSWALQAVRRHQVLAGLAEGRAAAAHRRAERLDDLLHKARVGLQTVHEVETSRGAMIELFGEDFRRSVTVVVNGQRVERDFVVMPGRVFEDFAKFHHTTASKAHEMLKALGGPVALPPDVKAALDASLERVVEARRPDAGAA